MTTETILPDLVQKWQRERGIAPAPGSREAAMVVIHHDEDGKPTVWCDPEIADLVRALNGGGVETVASCSGHGHRPGNIMLADGRVLVVCKDADEAREVESHFPGINGEAPQPADPDGGEYPSNEWVTAFFGSPDDSGFYYFRGDFGNIAHRYKNSAKHLFPKPAEPVVKESLTVPELMRVPQHLIDRLQRHCEDKSNSAFARSSMREALQYLIVER